MRNTLLFCLIYVPFLMAALGVSPAQSEDEYVFLLKGRGNVFWKVIREGIEETAKDLKVKAVILNTDDDQTPEAQLNMCLTSIARKPRVIVMGAATKNIGIECFRKASSQGIIVADIDGNVTLEDASEAKVKMGFTVASDNVFIGRTAADFLAGHAKQKAPKVLVIKGLPGSIVSEKRATGFTVRLKELLPDAEIVGDPAANWDRKKAMDTTLDYLQREKQLDFIFSVSDVMTTGVVEAIKVASRQKDVLVLSVDGNADARKALQEGKMFANVAQIPFLMGKRSVELAVKASSEGMSDYSEYVPTPILTKEILDQKNDPNLRFLR